MPISAPARLSAEHDTSRFRCQHDSLTLWLQKHALTNNGKRASRTHVVCDGARVVGFYALAAGSVQHEHAPKSVTRNMPKPIPAIILGRLAVDADHQGQGVGAGLLQDAVFRALNAASDIAARVLLCHAIDDAARSFYIHHGFPQSPVDELTVMLDLAKAAALIR
jgi:GNAT superfamily N-acetyltransferase